MAKPIEPTPVLKGKNAERFYKSIRDAKDSSKKEAQLQRSREISKEIRSHKRTATS